jgi:hypothetical protein
VGATSRGEETAAVRARRQWKGRPAGVAVERKACGRRGGAQSRSVVTVMREIFFIYDDRRGAEVADRIPCGATDGRLIPSITVRAKASNRWSKVSSKL